MNLISLIICETTFDELIKWTLGTTEGKGHPPSPEHQELHASDKMPVFPRRRRPSISGNISSKAPTLLNVLTWAQYCVSISVRTASTERMFAFVGDLRAAGRSRVDAGPWKVRALGLFFFFLKTPLLLVWDHAMHGLCVCVCVCESEQEKPH